MNQISIKEAAILAKVMHGEIILTTSLKRDGGKTILSAEIIGGDKRMLVHIESPESCVDHLDNIGGQKSVEMTAKRICISAWGLAIWPERVNPIRFLMKQTANCSTACLISVQVEDCVLEPV